ncbi:MAG: response regulator [Deltaproteobacteria bacterium]|nr:MAG: response regulator [Deltaproteobacteria bacterium]
MELHDPFAAGLQAGSGDPFFQWLVHFLGQSLDASQVILGEPGAGGLELVAECGEAPLGTWPTSWRVSTASVDLVPQAAEGPDFGTGRLIPVISTGGHRVGALAVLADGPLPVDEVERAVASVRIRVADELIQRRERRVIEEIVRHTTPYAGDDFFRALVDAAVEVLHVDAAYVASYDEQEECAHMVAHRRGDTHLPPKAYDLAGTPCEQIYATGDAVIVVDDVTRAFPGDGYLIEVEARSYVGVPFFDAERELVGHLGVIHSRPIEVSATARSLFEIFAARAGAELSRKRAEDERRRLQTRMAAAERADSLGLMAGGIAHDVNNLLVALVGNLSLAQRAMGEDDPAREYLDAANKAAERARSLGRRLLSYSGESVVAYEHAHSLDLLVAETVELLRPSLPEGVVVMLELNGAGNPLHCDEVQIGQIVLNLLTNAAEACEGGGKIRVRMEPQHHGDVAGIGLVVEDSGVGMDPATRAQIFEPFFSTKRRGRGLGLAAVHGTVEGHGGTISVRSARGQGTTFELWFPLAAQTSRPFEPIEWPADGCALVVDDDVTVRTVTEAMLEVLGIRTVLASSASEAMARLDEHRDCVHCVFTDLVMPGLAGRAWIETLRARRPDTHLVVMTGHDDREMVQWLHEVGVSAVLHKPFQVTDMERVVAVCAGARVAS